MKFKFYYVDSHTGSGKTYALRFVINPNSKAIIGTPRTGISNEIAKDLREFNISVKVISGKTHAKCRKAFREAVKSGKHAVIIANHSVVMRKYPGAEETDPCITADFDLYIDEAPKVDEAVSLKEEHEHLKEAFASVLQGHIGIDTAFLELGYTTHVADVLDKHKRMSGAAVTQFSDSYIRFCHARKDPDYRVVIRAEELRRYQDGAVTKEAGEDVDTLHFHLLKQPTILDGYKSVTFMAANFLHMEVYRHWERLVDFVPHPVMTDRLRYSDFSHKAGLFHIHFLSEDHGSWSKLQEIGYQHFLDKTKDAFVARFGNVEHIFCVKKNKPKLGEEPFVWGLDNEHNAEGKGHRLDPSAKGINGFQHVTYALHLVPLNPPTRTFRFKNDYFNMNGEALKAAIGYESHYQFASRTNARDFDDRRETHIFVLDRRAAEELAEKYGPACAGEPQFFDIGISEFSQVKDEAKTAKQRKAKQRERKKIEENDHENTIQYDDFLFRQWTHKGCTEPLVHHFTWSEIVTALSSLAKTQTLKSKYNSAEFREGFFADHSVHTCKGNIKSAKLMLFDIDKATRDPNELSAFLTRNNISHLIFHSFSSTPLEPRFHVIIPMSEAVNQQNYARIFNLLKADIEAAFGDAFEVEEKYFSFNHRMSNPYVSNFKADLIIDGTVWKDVMTYTHAFLDVRFFLNERNEVVKLSKRAPTYDRKASSVSEKDKADTARQIIDNRAVAPGEKKGRDNFYDAGVELAKAGFSYIECVQILAENKHLFGRGGGDRNAKDAVEHIFSKRRAA